MSNNKPIKRVDLFFTEDEFSLEREFAKEYLENDINTKVFLYRVDRTKTTIDDIYSEGTYEEIKTHSPVELPVSLVVEESILKSYNSNNTLNYKDIGNLVFTVLIDFLTEKDIDIKKGDYVGYQIDDKIFKFWTVVDDDKTYQTNAKSIMGYKPLYRKIICVTTDPNEFKG
jgi:hypothetical protein